MRGVKDAGAAFQTGGRQLEDFGRRSASAGNFTDALTRRMFSLRNVATALLGGATLAGLVFWIRNLAAAAFEASEAGKQMTATFEAFNANMTDWLRRALFGADAAEDMSVNIARLGKAAGIATVSLETQLTALGDLQRALKDGIERSGKYSAQSLILRAAQEEVTKRIWAQYEALKKFSSLPPEKFKRIFESAFGVDVTRQPVSQEEIFSAAQIIAPEELARKLEIAARAASLLKEEMIKGDIPISTWADRIQSLGQSLLALGIPLDKVTQAIPEFVSVAAAAPVHMDNFKLHLADMIEGLDKGRIQASLFEAAIQGVAAAIAQAAIEGGTSFKKLVAEIIEGLARMMITYGTMFLALGIIASTPWGAFLGNPADFFAASAIMFAGAAVAIAISKAMGGSKARESSPDRFSSGGESFAAAGPTTRSVNVTVEIEGSVIGMGMSTAEFARNLAEELEVAFNDNQRVTVSA